ncbi:MAG: triose-phosphate isomerase [SAR324 cluster bacterium]|nr:triose-phosphate isomerase [SAR324 cluster bacterium]
MCNWIVGNWKMNGSLAQAVEFTAALLKGIPANLGAAGTRVAICPPHPYLTAVGERIAGSQVELGAQKVHPLPSGAFTGEISPVMLSEFGVSVCIIGHSEHRQYFGVTDVIIAQKLHALTAVGIIPILCVGETLVEREADRQKEVIETQLRLAMKDSEEDVQGRQVSDTVLAPHPELSEEAAGKLVIAYEPVWAIGTGQTATPEQANGMHEFIRDILRERYSESLAEAMPILYGGSVNEENAGELLRQPDINGALVGGASLKADAFLSIINQAIK